ncbi:MAG: UDP-N-acetylmuramoyl-L-alanyl-D-glutamate--2,6-diaminopimelate ligase [Micromonosporaceae bacterium]|nr:UDP-N-acetylmuramoyl-L-alanyl-D-glutamate--2,6-diaminopimelate ligase [Micromonosporaceae bacterium]
MSGYPRPRNVPATPLGDLAALIAARIEAPTAPPAPTRPTAPPVPAVTGITHASDAVVAGDLYAALPGSRRHGAEFVAEAAAAGALAVLTDPAGADRAVAAGLPALVVDDPRAVLGIVGSRVYGDPSRHLTVIGITGTAGKTSTAYLIESGLRAAGRTAGLIGTVETRLGGLVVDSARTTPEATDLQAVLAAARQYGVDTVVMEVSSHALALGRVDGVRFAVGGFTNLGADHLDFHADMAAYFAAKARLFDGRCAIEIVNVGDPYGRRLVRPGTVTYVGPAAGVTAAEGFGGGVTAGEGFATDATAADGFGNDVTVADWRASDVTAAGEGGFGQRFVVHGPGGVAVDAGVSMPGRHNVANALLAIASLVAIGVDAAVAARGVADCPGVPGRMERVPAPGPVIGVVDYAHKPDSVTEVLAALRPLVAAKSSRGRRVTAGSGRVICVIGAGGDRDRGKRPLMGTAAARGADVVIVTDDNPRTESPAAIRAELLAAARAAGGADVTEVEGRRAAVDEAVRLAAPGDVVALLGKGHERGQEIDGAVYPFDDRVALSAALTTRFGPLTGGPVGTEPASVGGPR